MSPREKMLTQIQEINRTLYGMEDIIKIYCLSKAADLTVLLLGPHATAKSSLARMWSITTGLNYRIVASSEIDESLICYIDPAVFREKNIVQMRRGELMEKDHIIIDEYFLWLNKYRAKLHQLLEEKTYAGLESLVKTYSFLCLDEITEVLTFDGWKTWQEVRLGDKVLSLNPSSGCLEWTPVLALYAYDYDGPMVSINDRDLDVLVTPNHRFPVYDKHKGILTWRLAFDLKRQRDKIIQSGKVLFPTKEQTLSDDIVRLMAWLKTEGRLEPGDTLLIYQSEGPYVAEIDNLLQRLNIDYVRRERIRSSGTKEYIWTIHAKDGKWIKNIVKDKILRISDLHKLTPKQLEIFFEEALKGDGWRKRPTSWSMFCSKHKETIDTFQYLCVLLGKRCMVKKRVGFINNGPRKGQPYTMWYAYIPKGPKEHLVRKYSIVPYRGKVWCLHTKYENFLVRRNGKIHLTGNSNPLSEYYAGQIPEVNMATMDRIDLLIPVYQPSVVPSETMIRKFSQYGRKEKPLRQVITWEDYLKARQEIFEVELPSRVVIWLTLFAHSLASCKHVKDKWSESLARMKKLCSSCNEQNHLCAKAMLSKPRFLRATVILAKALAWLKGKKSVSFEEVHEAIKYTLPHRLTWIQEEKTYVESLEAVQDLVSQFNDEMLAWKNRGTFDDLAKIIERSRQVPPKFEDELAQKILADVSELHILHDFVKETLEATKKEIKQYYFLQGINTHFDTMTELKEFLESSGLDVFTRDELLLEIALHKQHLSLAITHTPDNIKGLVNALSLLHKEQKIKIDSKRILLARFAERVSFDSPLLKVREKNGMIYLIFEEEKIKKDFQQIWDEICQVQKRL